MDPMAAHTGCLGRRIPHTRMGGTWAILEEAEIQLEREAARQLCKMQVLLLPERPMHSSFGSKPSSSAPHGCGVLGEG